MIPNYLVIGAPKCGTTSLCDLLGQHPDVFMSEPKEIHFFGRTDPRKTLAWYEAHFDAAGSARAVGEGSTSYTHPDIINGCAAAIAERIPQCRLIYMVRNPLTRLESDWRMRALEGWAQGASINEAVTLQPTLVTQGKYWENINVYRRLFSDEQILIVFLEDFARDPGAELDRCFAHIGVPSWHGYRDAEQPRNAATGLRDGSIARFLRTSGLDTFKRALPGWLLEAGKSLLLERHQHVLTWDAGVREGVVGAFQDDARQLLEFCGKDPGYWTYR
jgi:hypothetical protein